MKILLLAEAMGDFPNACKGFYLCKARTPVITINSDLPEELQRIILMHEIAHAVLHSKASSIKAFHDFALFDEASLYEYEANIFTADYLLDDDEVLDLLNEDLSFFGAASRLKRLGGSATPKYSNTLRYIGNAKRALRLVKCEWALTELSLAWYP